MYEDLIQEFITAQGATSKAEISRYNKHLRLGVELLEEMHLSKPNQDYYLFLEERLKATQKSQQTRDKSLSRVRNFWEFISDKEKQINMFDDNDNVIESNVTESDVIGTDTGEGEGLAKSEIEAQEGVQSEAVDTQKTAEETAKPDKPTKQRGRPKKYELGDKSKLTLYLTAEMFNLIKVISKAKNISMTEYAVDILEQDLAKKKSVVEQILALQESL